jgi:Rgg/GadR/MutR family transcriptional activator
MEIHELLRKIRKDRGFSQKNLAHNITSRESIAKYENGERNIPFTILLEILDRLNVNVDEFLFYLENDSIERKNIGMNAIMKVNNKEKISSKYHLQKLRKKIAVSNDIADVRNYLIVKTYHWSNGLEDERSLNKKDREYLKILKDYLEKVEEWGRFEMVSFASLLFLFDTAYIRQRISEVNHKLAKIKGNEIFNPVLSYLYHQAFLLMLERKHGHLAKQYLEKFHGMQHESFIIHNSSMTYRFYHALILYLERKGRQEKKQILTIMKGLELIGEKQLIEEFRNKLKKFEKIYHITPQFFEELTAYELSFF